jgi:hypothetical protein
MSSEKRLIVVLGMHRSGTSAVTKGLEAMGVDLGSEFYPARPDNPKGDWEDRRFHSLNEELLKASHQSWDDPGQLETEPVVEASQRIFLPDALALVNDRLRDAALVGIKDPRFSVLLPFWKRIFAEAGMRVSYVISFRNPLSVAESLWQRNAFPKSKALQLWVAHYERIISETAGSLRVVVDYDALLDAPGVQLARVAHFLDLTVEEPALAVYSTEFLDPALRHSRFSVDDIEADLDCDRIVLKLYQELGRQALTPSPESSSQ